MNAKVTIKDDVETNICNAYDISSKEAFDYEDNEGGKSHINVYNSGVIINRVAKEHTSFIHLIEDDSYIKVTTNEGEIKLNVKVIEKSINNDIVIIVYKIDDIEKTLQIEYF